jgi:uncharacterized protein involved in outer membrane biogenesis
MLRLSGRVRKILVAVVAGLVVIVAVALAILPEVVRRVAVDQVPKLTGRVLALDDVDLNLFTGHLALKGVRLLKRGVNERALELERLDVRIGYLPFLFRTVRVKEISLVGAKGSILRRGPTEFDFSDVLDRLKGTKAEARKESASSAKWTIQLDRISLQRVTILMRDATTSPESEWRIDDVTIETRNLMLGEGARPGNLEAKLKVNGAPIVATADSLAIVPLAASARVTVDGFDLAPLRPYLTSAPAAPRAGKVNAALALAIELAPTGLKRGTVRGGVALNGLEILQAGRTDPFLTVPGLSVKINDADLVARAFTIGAIEVDGLSLRAVRDAQEKIDLVALGERPKTGDQASAAEPAPSPAASAPTPPSEGSTPGPAAQSENPPPQLKLKIEQIALRNGTATFRDEFVKPITTLAITELTADVKNLTWPSEGPAPFAVSMKLPQAGRMELKGTAVPAPLDIEAALSLKNGRIEPYQAYFPVPARFAGSFNGETRNHVTITNGVLAATSRGSQWIEKFTMTAPGEKTPAAQFERLRFDGIDFSWPKYARVSKIALVKPEMRVERDKDGVISLRKMFTADGRAPSRPEKPAPKETKAKPASKPAEPPKPGGLPITVEIGTITIEEGYARFLDRTVDPAFAQEISRLGLVIEGLSSVPGRRARVATQAVIGGSSAFDLKGEIAPIGEVYADLTGELRDFKLSSVNPYADPLTAWFMKTGELAIKMHFRIEKNQLTAENDIEVKNLTVAPARENDEVKKKVGLPLGMIVALVTDQDNGIKVNVPLSGEVSQVRADPSDAIWTAVRNAVVNIVSSPFRAIGRIGKGSGNTVDEMNIDAVTFAPGSADVAPEMEQHLTKVADFLRGAPQVKLGMAPVAAPRDAESLRAQEITLRIQRLQAERGLPDFAAAVAVAFKEQFPDVPTPKTEEEQLAVLKDREPAPDARMQELQARRLEAVRASLSSAQGIPADRLVPGSARAAADAAAEGRVELTITN